jgi:hypothetical protein
MSEQSIAILIFILLIGSYLLCPLWHQPKGVFSKLKLLKNHMRSTISQERLNSLATIFIEKKLLDEIDIDIIINDFASRLVRRKF